MTRLLPADSAQLDAILQESFAIWGEGLSLKNYGAWNRAQMATRWGRDHLRRFALVDDGTVLASAKRYDLQAVAGGQAVAVAGIGAVFTPEALRGRGHARRLVDLLLSDATERGCRYALLFSEIGAAYYESMGFRIVPRTVASIDVIAKAGAPATFVRCGTDSDLAAIAEISARYREGAVFGLDRSADQIAFFFTRRRLLAGLGPANLRAAEFFVSEEGHRPVAYVFITRGPSGVVLEECGDLDPSGARVGAILQVLAARTPAEHSRLATGWLPPSFRPPQLRVIDETPSAEIMMIRPLGSAPWPVDDPARVVYWQTDVF